MSTTQSITFQGITITLTAVIDGATKEQEQEFLNAMEESHKTVQACIKEHGL